MDTYYAVLISAEESGEKLGHKLTLTIDKGGVKEKITGSLRDILHKMVHTHVKNQYTYSLDIDNRELYLGKICGLNKILDYLVYDSRNEDYRLDA